MLKEQAFVSRMLAYAKTNDESFTIDTAELGPDKVPRWALRYITAGWLAQDASAKHLIVPTAAGKAIIQQWAPGMRPVGRPPLPDAIKQEREAKKLAVKQQKAIDDIAIKAAGCRAMYGMQWLQRLIERLATV